MTPSICKFLILLPIRLYQRLISPLFPPTCRFYPSCSRYIVEAVETHGLRAGITMGIKRILCCHPWHPGGFQPVPAPKNQSNPSISKGDSL